MNKYCIQWDICPILFSPLSPLMSEGEVKTGRTPMSQIVSLKHIFVWENSRQSKTIAIEKRVKITLHKVKRLVIWAFLLTLATYVKTCKSALINPNLFKSNKNITSHHLWNIRYVFNELYIVLRIKYWHTGTFGMWS